LHGLPFSVVQNSRRRATLHNGQLPGTIAICMPEGAESVRTGRTPHFHAKQNRRMAGSKQPPWTK